MLTWTDNYVDVTITIENDRNYSGTHLPVLLINGSFDCAVVVVVVVRGGYKTYSVFVKHRL